MRGRSVEIPPPQAQAGNGIQLQSSMGSFGTVQNRSSRANRAGRGIYTASAASTQPTADRATPPTIAGRLAGRGGPAHLHLERFAAWTMATSWCRTPAHQSNRAHRRAELGQRGRGGLTADVATPRPRSMGLHKFYSTWGHNAIADRSDTDNTSIPPTASPAGASFRPGRRSRDVRRMRWPWILAATL